MAIILTLFAILCITIPRMHHNNMSLGSGLWHFLNRLLRIQAVASSDEKEVATTESVLAETGTGRHREW